MKTSTIRNFRINNQTWGPAKIQADKLGVSMTLIVKTALMVFARDPRVTIGEPEEIIMPKDIQAKAEKLNEVVKLAIRNKKSQ